MNKVFLIGNLTAKPELRQTPTGKMVATVSLATNETFVDKDNQKQVIATFHNIVAWGRGGENLAKYTDKGSKVAITGKITNRSYEAKDGTKRYISEIIADGIEFLSAPINKEPSQEVEQTEQQVETREPFRVNDPDFDKEVEKRNAVPADDTEINVSNIPF